MVGIDFSMNCPGVVIGSSKNPHDLYWMAFAQKKKMVSLDDKFIIKNYPEYDIEEERHDKMTEEIIDFILEYDNFDDKEVYIENYSYGSTGNVFNIAECTGCLKQKFYKLGYNINLVPPKTLKKQFSDNGNAGKDLMYESFLEYTKNYDFSFYKMIDDISAITTSKKTNKKRIPAPISDLVDAYFLLQYGLSQYAL